MKKGISPIVASVILIAITMAIAGILSFWAGNFVQRNIQETENSTESYGCLDAKFRVYSTCKYYTQNKEIVLILENQRVKDLTLDNLYIFYPSNLKQYKLSSILTGNQLVYFNSTVANVTPIDPGFQSFEIRTTCSGVSLTFNCSEVS